MDRSELSEEDAKAWKRRILKSYLQQFLVEPLPETDQVGLSNFFRSYKDDVFCVSVPTLKVMKQVAQCYLLSFGRDLRWVYMSSHELVKTLIEQESSLFGLMLPDIVIIVHGFDSFPNKLDTDSINQVASSREARGKKTLIIMGTGDVGVKYTPLQVYALRDTLPSSEGSRLPPRTIAPSLPGKVKPDMSDERLF